MSEKFSVNSQNLKTNYVKLINGPKIMIQKLSCLLKGTGGDGELRGQCLNQRHNAEFMFLIWPREKLSLNYRDQNYPDYRFLTRTKSRLRIRSGFMMD